MLSKWLDKFWVNQWNKAEYLWKYTGLILWQSLGLLQIYSFFAHEQGKFSTGICSGCIFFKNIIYFNSKGRFYRMRRKHRQFPSADSFFKRNGWGWPNPNPEARRFFQSPWLVPWARAFLFCFSRLWVVH